ncbi:MAG: hypothetical protein M3044_04825, partial [Thermoproteota archaeon]|nr:hypothetical protein [Thermoproteota archaeon]
ELLRYTSYPVAPRAAVQLSPIWLDDGNKMACILIGAKGASGGGGGVGGEGSTVEGGVGGEGSTVEGGVGGEGSTVEGGASCCRPEGGIGARGSCCRPETDVMLLF